MPQKKYIVRLTAQEREICRETIRKLNGSSEKVRRAQMLVKADADRPPEQDEPRGRGERRTVRQERRGACPPNATRRCESGVERPRGAVVGADDRATVHGRGAGRRRREPSNRALGTRRAGVGADEPGPRTKVDWALEVARPVGRTLRRLREDHLGVRPPPHTFYEVFEPARAREWFVASSSAHIAETRELAEHRGERTEFDGAN